MPGYSPAQHHWALLPGKQHGVRTAPSHPILGIGTRSIIHFIVGLQAGKSAPSNSTSLQSQQLSPLIPPHYILFYKCKAISIEVRDTEAQRKRRIISYLPLILTIPKDPSAICLTFYMYAQLISITRELQVFSDVVEGISCNRTVSKLFLLFLLQPTLIIQGNGITGTKQKHG